MAALARAWASFPAAVALSPIEEAVISRSAARTVIYFFAKQDQFVQCEMHPGRPHVLTVIDADGVNTPSGITAWTNSWSAGPKSTDSSRATAGLGPLAETAAGESRHHGAAPRRSFSGVNRDGIVSAGESRPLSGPPTCTPMTSSSSSIIAPSRYDTQQYSPTLCGVRSR
jgi:hypothetical protein